MYYVPLTNNLFCDELLYRLKQHNKVASKKNAVKTNEILLDDIGLAVKFQNFVHTFLYPFQDRVFDHYKGLVS